ncbi:unnamed protein product [Cuscuta epithymum]|uniref:Delta(3)-Delta(2)-enoyl-CoA isomerase n=1 Tax=Cuscuta epithymum TaxID=186058 RepID=A0AAV0DCE2_9ASTE|nr:unnamed protein product [Cuscuta epithymum]
MCTLEKRGDIFYLTLTGADEHRLNPSLISSISTALAEIKFQADKGSVLVTKAEGNFFSNGFDLKYAQAAGSPAAAMDRLQHMVDLFKPIAADLISLPMPTIAAVTGHAAAAGLMLAICHDYVMMRSDKGVMYMSELDIGLPLPEYFTAIIRSKVGSHAARRALVLKASKLRAAEALKLGLIDSAHADPEETVKEAVRTAESLAKRRWDGKIYAELRRALLPEACGVFGLPITAALPSRL